MVVRLLIALVLGVLAYVVASLFLPHTISLLIGIVAGVAYYFEGGRF